MRRTTVVWMAWVIALAAATYAQPTIVFEREHIRVVIAETSISVEGTYVFRNDSPSPITTPVYYPFPVDSLHPFPTEVLVRTEAGDTIPHRSAGGPGVGFSLELRASDRTTFRVAYEQPSRDQGACYILTTTRVWKRPLERADFEVVVPDGIELLSMSYEASDVDRESGAAVHRFSRSDFMPAKDLCVRWRRADR